MAVCGHCKEKLKKGSDLFLHIKRSGCVFKGWAQVKVLHEMGKIEAAQDLANELLGVQKKPMSQADRDRLDLHKQEHKEEISLRKKFDRKSASRHRK